MKELSLNILDIAENSVRAGASLTEIIIDETEKVLSLTIKDNGCGMTTEQLKGVVDPFFTTRTTRKVGLGIPLLKLSAEQTGGSFEISSVSEKDNPQNHGTTVKTVFLKDSIDFTPLGNTVSSVVTLIQGHPETDFSFCHTFFEKSVRLDTRELREQLEGVPLNTFEVIKWVEEYLGEQYSDLYK